MNSGVDITGTLSMRITLPDGRTASIEGTSEYALRRKLLAELGIAKLPVGARIEVYRNA